MSVDSYLFQRVAVLETKVQSEKEKVDELKEAVGELRDDIGRLAATVRVGLNDINTNQLTLLAKQEKRLTRLETKQKVLWGLIAGLSTGGLGAVVKLLGFL